MLWLLLMGAVFGQAVSTDEIAVSGGGFAETIDPDEGASTVLASNASGAKTAHDYATGADISSTWLAGGLPATVSLGRAGSLSYGYSADGARDLTSMTWPGVSSAGFVDSFDGGSVTLGRDEAGNIDAITDRSGERDLDYDKNRLTTTDWLSGELNAYKMVRAYDGSGRLDTVTLHRNGSPIHVIDFGFNGESSEISGVGGTGFSASYGRDATSRFVTGVTRGGVTQNWGRGMAGRITSADSNVTGAPEFDYTGFDSKGRRGTVATNRGTWTYAYRGGATGDGQLASATATGNDLGTFTYDFDGIGRRASGVGQGDPNQSDSLNQLQSFFHGTQQKHLYISLDPAATVRVNGVDVTPSPFDVFLSHPLTSPGSSGGWVSWAVEGTLDQAGEYGSPPVDAVAEVTGNTWFPPEEESFIFDADGNRESSSLWNYGWDGRNRLVRARTVDWATAAEGWDLGFDYDAEGRRFKKEVTRYASGEAVDHKVIYFVWDGWDLVYERHEDANRNALLERKYVWGLDISGSRGGAGGAGGMLLMRETRGETTTDYYPLYDGTGHVVGLSDDNGNMVAEYWWGPFGELIEAKGEMGQANPWRYATKYYDSETGLYYFGQRYYDPVTGQWLNREPLGEDESLNLYAYCGNDPVNKVDVRGLEAIDISGDVASLNGQYTALMALIAEAGNLAGASSLTDANLESLVDQFQTGYDSYLGGVRRLQGRVVANQTGHGMVDGWWHRDALSRNFNAAFGLPIVPGDTDIAGLLPTDRLLDALSHSAGLSGIVSDDSIANVMLAGTIHGELQTMQTRVNYISAATGLAGVGRVAIARAGEGGMRAGLAYLTRTAGGFALGFAGSAGAEYTLGQAQEHGLVSDNQALALRTGISLFQIILAKRALNSQTASSVDPGLSARGVRPAPGTRVRPDGIPSNWRIRNTRGRGGTEYYNSRNENQSIRIMQADPSSPYPNSQVPYARQRNAGGTYYKSDGTLSPLPRGGLRDPDAHIPLDQFQVR